MSDVSDHRAALEQKIRDTFTPNVTTGRDIQMTTSSWSEKKSTAAVVTIIAAW